MFRAISNRRAISLIDTPSARYSRRISAQSSTAITLQRGTGLLNFQSAESDQYSDGTDTRWCTATFAWTTSLLSNPITAIGVLDWGMATLGDLLTDLASMALWWTEFGDSIVRWRACREMCPDVPAPMPSFRRMPRKRGDLSEFSWYFGFANYRIAVIFEGIHYRNGTGSPSGRGSSSWGDGPRSGRAWTCSRGGRLVNPVL
ncbi:phosphotransferase [Nocardia vinacea]|uniref:phosphotransferase n=1 Tax=Nocardia vinacea TaxID=96468 RepID=UPI003AF21D83